MKTFEIIKKNRKYFAAKIDGKIPCKILIDDKSESLELGTQTLEVEDISVRSKYGTDLIYKLTASADDVADAGITTLRTPFYNQNLVAECHRLGGKWDADEKSWVFSGLVADKVEELDEKYNSQLIPVEIEFNETLFGEKGPAYLAGFKIAQAWGRDSGAKLADGIMLIDGDINSGGSMKNWDTRVKQGAKIRMEVPEALLQGLFEHDVTVARLDTHETIEKAN